MTPAVLDPELRSGWLQHSLKVRHGHEYGHEVSVVTMPAGLLGKGTSLFGQFWALKLPYNQLLTVFM